MRKNASMRAEPGASRCATARVNASARALFGVCALALVGCSFRPDPDEGLVLHQQDYDFATRAPLPFDAGAVATEDGGGEALASCQHVSAFIEHVTPLFTTHCTECHDGTKIKAVFKLNLFYIKDKSPSAQEETCRYTLATANLEAPEESTIFTFLDPSNAETVHDFKFETMDEFVAYRTGVLSWLALEAASAAE